MLALALALVTLGHPGGTVGEAGDLELPRYPLQRVPEPERFVRRAGAHDFWSDGAVARFTGALVGGAIGAALPVLVMATQSCVGFCSPAPSLVLGLLASITSIAGATAGWALLGGELSPGAAVGGAIGGLALGTLLLFVSLALAPPSDPLRPAWPVVLAASAVAVGVTVLALEARHEALEEAPFLSVRTGRFVATTLSMLGTLSVGALLSIGLGALTYSSALALGLGVVTASLAPLVPLAVHRGLGGRGTAGWAWLGWLASLAIAGAAGAGAVAGAFAGAFGPFRDPRADATVLFAGAAGVFATVFGVPLFLEVSHGAALLERSEEAGRPRLSLAPVPGGAMGALALTF
ncbi:MAG: hypothetical protein JNJ54_20790 [Myxococcaceae bacterium]|nr:hypothetical protein [Myxococcaceae bacterium]